MKCHLQLVVLVFLVLNIGNAQDTSFKAENLGLISELVYVKSTSENYAIKILNDSLVSDIDKIEFVKRYNDTKVITDQCILQLITDIQKRNRLKYFNTLDKLLTKKKILELSETESDDLKINSYAKNLKKMATVYANLMAFRLTPAISNETARGTSLTGLVTLPTSLEELTGALGFVTSTLKEIREIKQKKVDKVASTLNEQRLLTVQEVMDAEKKE